MERSSRFISLSGLSGMAAGMCALVGAWFASQRIHCWCRDCQLSRLIDSGGRPLLNELFWIATLTFTAAFALAFCFTFLRSKKPERLYGAIPLFVYSGIRLCLLLAGAIFFGA